MSAATNCRSCDEASTRDALCAFLLSGAKMQHAFFQALDLSSTWDAAGELFSVECEVQTDAGKRIDLLLTAQRSAVAVEVKVDHRENLFQYAGYRRFLVRRGYSVRIVGILKRCHKSRGREALNIAVLEQLADRRISWAELVSRLQRIEKGAATARFRAEIAAVRADLLTNKDSEMLPKVTSLDVSKVDSRPEHLAAFFAEFVTQLGGEFTDYPDQAGSSPPLLRFGRQAWGTWFGDENAERLFLMIDHSRPSKPMKETEFSFGITLWDKNASGHRRPPRPGRVSLAATVLADKGFRFERNRPGRYEVVAWSRPFTVERTGFFYANALGDLVYRLRMSEAASLGGDVAVRLLAGEAQRLASVMDDIVRATI